MDVKWVNTLFCEQQKRETNNSRQLSHRFPSLTFLSLEHFLQPANTGVDYNDPSEQRSKPIVTSHYIYIYILVS